ncbi:MAG: tetratricopeptide repeat protein [Desulfococcaceae bacterium]
MGFRPLVAILIIFLLPATVPSMGRAESWEAELDRSRTLLRQQRFEAAEAAARSALQKAQSAYGTSSREAARVLSQLGAVHGWRHDHAAAETAKAEALRLMERHYGPHHRVLPFYLESLALTRSRQRRYDAAEPLYLRSLAIREAAVDPEHPDVAGTLSRLAENYRRQGKFAEAESLARRALAIRRKRLGPDHEAVGESLFFMATLFEMRRKYAEAAPWYREAMELRERRWGENSPRTASMARRLADALIEAGQFEEAEALYRRSMAIWDGKAGDEDPQTLAARRRLESLAARRGRTPRRERSDGPGQSDRLTREDWKNRMARVESLRESGDIAGALGVAEAAARDAEAAAGRSHPWVAAALTLAAGFRKTLGDLPGAEERYRRALNIVETAHGADSVEASLALEHLGEVYWEREKYPQAIALGERALAIWIGQFGADHPTVRARRERLEALRAEARRLALRVSLADSPAVDAQNGDSGLSASVPPARPEVWLALGKNLAATWRAAAEKWSRVKASVDVPGLEYAWSTHVDFLLRKFSWKEWAWIFFGTGFLVFLLLKDWN